MKRLGVLLALLLGCQPSAPAHTAGEIDLTSESYPTSALADEPMAAPPALRPCKKGEPSCTSLPQKQAPELDRNKRYVIPLLADDPVRGRSAAPITLVVFSDFQCPFCKQLEPVLAELLTRYPEQLKLVWKNHPLAMHQHAEPAALLTRQAFVEKGNDAFWKMHDQLFASQSQLGAGLVPRLKEEYQLTANTGAHRARVAQTLSEAAALGVNSTPTSFINGRPLPGAQPLWMYVELIEQELAALSQQAPAP